MTEPYERQFANQWIKLSGSDYWHRLPREQHQAALCGNPPSGIVLSGVTTEAEPPGPKCPNCLAKEDEGS